MEKTGTNGDDETERTKFARKTKYLSRVQRRRGEFERGAYNGAEVVTRKRRGEAEKETEKE